MDDLLRDVRGALRSFVKRPGFTVASVLVLALGIGAVTAMFSTLNSVVLEPLPFEDPDRLVWAWGTNETRNANSISALDYWDYRDQADVFESMAAFLVFTERSVITGGTQPERVFSTLVSANLFSTLGVSPQLGRTFIPEEESTGAANAVILGDGFWHRRYGADPDAVGTALTIGGESYEIVGVMPPGFDYPGTIELWFPMRPGGPYTNGRGNNNFFMFGRLREGVSLSLAQQQIDVIARRLEEAYPETNEAWGIRLQSLHERYFAGARQSLLVLMSLVGLVLLIACANVASLFLARATTRTNELALRLSLGASKMRVVRQLLTECVVIALTGGAFGLLLAHLGIGALKALGPADLPRIDSISIDAHVLVFAFSVSLAAGLMFGIIPALRGTRIGLAETLKVGGNRGTSHAAPGFRNALVVTQVALSLVLMVASGLLVQSYVRQQRVDPGFAVEQVVSVELQLPDSRYTGIGELQAIWSALQQEVRVVPGVAAVGAIDQLPIRQGGTYNHIYPAERPPETTSDRDQLTAQRRFASEDYFSTLGIPLLAGRAFAPTDEQGAPNVVVISKAMAGEFFPGEMPVGKVLILPWSSPPLSLEVVGVAGDVQEFGLGSALARVFYLPARQFPSRRMQLVIRAQGDPLPIVGAVRRAVWAVDRDVPVSAAQTLEQRAFDSLAQPRFRTFIVALFAVMALILTSTGLYGVLAYFVRQRTRELGIRIALGATPRTIVGLIVGKGMIMVAAGIGLGLLGSFAGGRVLRSFLFDVRSTDALTFGGVSLVLAAVAFGACLVPAIRALRVDPQEVLRTE